MSLSGIGFIAVYTVAMLLAFARHPGFGLFAYFWVFYNDPHAHWWGAGVPELRWSLLAAVATMIALMMKKAPEREANVSPEPRPTNWALRLLVLLAAWSWLQSAWAMDIDKNIDEAVLLTKYVVLFWIICRVIRDAEMLEWVAWIHVLGCVLWSWTAFGAPLEHGRLEMNFGPGVDDSNIIAFHLLTGIAFAGLMFTTLKGFRRWIAFASLPLMMNTIVLTGSRGALIGLVASGAAAVFFSPLANRRIIVVFAALGLVLLLFLANDTLLNRAKTITLNEGEMDSSAAIRLMLLYGNWEMFKDSPFGTGARSAEIRARRYLPKEALNADGVRSPHNTMMAVLVDHGLPAALIIIALYGWAALQLLKLRRLDRFGLPPFLGMFRAAIAGSLMAYIVCGIFINMFRAEVAIWMLALLTVVLPMAHSATSAPNRNTEETFNAAVPRLWEG